MKDKTIVVNCPTCGKQVPWQPQSQFRPFCSQRCKQIDLGAWANDEYCVPGESEPLAPAGDDAT